MNESLQNCVKEVRISKICYSIIKQICEVITFLTSPKAEFKRYICCIIDFDKGVIPIRLIHGSNFNEGKSSRTRRLIDQ